MQQQFFSDREIEEYLDGMFQGDVHAMEAYLKTPEGKERLTYYNALYAALKNEPEPVIGISLSHSVMTAIEKRKASTLFKWNYMLWLVGGIAVMVLLFYCVRLMDNFSFLNISNINSNLVMAIIIMTLLIVAFQGIDVRERQRRFKNLIDQTSTISQA